MIHLGRADCFSVITDRGCHCVSTCQSWFGGIYILLALICFMFIHLLLFTSTILGTCWAHHRCVEWSLGVCQIEEPSLVNVDKAVVSGSTEVSRSNRYLIKPQFYNIDSSQHKVSLARIVY